MVVSLVGFWVVGPGHSLLFIGNEPTAFAQQSSGLPPITFPSMIQWSKQKGVSNYRLQIADDEDFRNIYYDGRVVGERYTARGLAPGYYYWRIAPAERQTGAFSKPLRFFVSGGVVISVTPSGSPATRPRLPTRPGSRVH